MLSQIDLTRNPTEEELKILTQYGLDGLKPRYLAAVLNVPVQMLFKNPHFKLKYEQAIANTVHKTMNTLFECFEANKTTRIAGSCIMLLKMWNASFTNTFCGGVSGTYQEKMSALEDALSKNEISTEEYKSLALAYGDRFRNEEYSTNQTKLRDLITEVVEHNNVLTAENKKLSNKLRGQKNDN